jgi:hypothetical protein
MRLFHTFGEGKGGGDIIGLSFGCGSAALWLDFENTRISTGRDYAYIGALHILDYP